MNTLTMKHYQRGIITQEMMIEEFCHLRGINGKRWTPIQASILYNRWEELGEAELKKRGLSSSDFFMDLGITATSHKVFDSPAAALWYLDLFAECDGTSSDEDEKDEIPSDPVCDLGNDDIQPEWYEDECYEKGEAFAKQNNLSMTDCLALLLDRHHGWLSFVGYENPKGESYLSIIIESYNPFDDAETTFGAG